MAKVMVTRGGQITLTQDVREKMKVKEGDVIIINVLGDCAMVSKGDHKALEKHNFYWRIFPKYCTKSALFHSRNG